MLIQLAVRHFIWKKNAIEEGGQLFRVILEILDILLIHRDGLEFR
jgi:hypothetical protein